MTRKLIEQMLEALLDDAIESRNPEQQSAITAAREYLAQPEQSGPCGWVLREVMFDDDGIPLAHREVKQNHEQGKFLAKGMRFKTSQFPYGVCINGLPKELAGRWVALVAAEDDCHLKPAPPYGSKRAAAMAVYKPPFKYKYGYIYDSQNLMVADDGGIGKEEPGVEGAVAARVRGWGRLGYLPNGAELQDEIGHMMADALNKLYEVEA